MNNLFDSEPSLSVRSDLVLGVDGGGSHTVAVLAERDTGLVLGRGKAGPSNIQTGESDALRELDAAIDRAFTAASLDREPVAAACLGLAGIDRNEGLDLIHSWASQRHLSQSLTVANDATLLLAAGTPDGWGLAVVAGTGSIAFARRPDGEVGRCGGWGYLLGDEGSGYQIALAGIRAACRAFDRCGPETVLVNRFVQAMDLREPPDLIPAVYRGKWDRPAIAGLAPIVLTAAREGDAVAAMIGDRHAKELARTAVASAKANDLPLTGLPLVLTGGVILGSDWFRAAFLRSLKELGVQADPVRQVADPVCGAVILARKLADSE